MYRIDNIAGPGGCTLGVEADNVKDLWKEAAFLQSIPHICPVDGSPTRFGYKEPSKYKYWILYSTGERVYEFKFGLDTDTGELFYGSIDKDTKAFHKRWTWYDFESKRDYIVWEDGKLTPDGKRLLASQPVASGIHADDNPDRYPESLGEVEEIAPEPPQTTNGAVTHRKMGTCSEAQLNTLHALGMAYYTTKEEWDDKRKGLVYWASGGRRTSSVEMYVAECVKLQEALEKKLRIAYAQVAEGWPSPFDLDDIDSMYGVELANAYKKLKALVAAPKAAQDRRNAIAAIRN